MIKALASILIRAVAVAVTLAQGTAVPAGAQAGGAQAPGQVPVPPVSYSVDVSLVEVDAVVTGADGRIVRGLGREDFEVLENGVTQTLDRVSFVEIPIERAAYRREAATDVQANTRPFEGRLYVLLLDDLHTAASRTDRVRSAARRFVEQNLLPGDLAAVVHVAQRGASQDFTNDRSRLLKSVDQFAGRQLRSQTLNEIDQYNRERLFSGRTPVAVRDLDEEVRAHDAQAIFDTIAGVARRLAPVKGRRKALLWFGEGISYDMFAETGRPEASLVRERSRDAVRAASAANLAIYGVDARGLAGMGDEAIQISSPAADPTGSLGASGLRQELLRSQENLRRAADDTGGFAVTNTDNIQPAFERVVEENSAYYLLGYYPADPKRDGSFRRLEVRVRRPGVRVRARSGYVSAARKELMPETDGSSPSAAALQQALASPIPQSSLPMSVHVAPFRGTDERASVLVTVEYGAVAFNSSGVVSPDRDRLDASVVAVDPSGKVFDSDHSTITLNVKPETRQAMKVLGFRTHARLELAPGRYQVRAASTVAGSGLVGSVQQDVDVPDFTKSPLELSGLAVTSVVAGYTPTARFDERMREVLPAPPSAVRDFRNDEAMALFVEIYERGGTPSSDVTVQASIRDRDGKVVFEREDVRTPDDLRRTKGGYPLQISLRQLPPGDFTVRLEARLRKNASATAARETAFQVWDVNATGPAPASTATSTSDSLPFVPVAKGPLSSVRELRHAVARTPAEWEALWQSLSMRSARPAVTFDNTMVVAIFLGARPTAGYDAEVVGVRREGDVLVVQWRERAPADAGNPPNQTTPFVLAGVPQHAGEVRFEKVDPVKPPQ